MFFRRALPGFALLLLMGVGACDRPALTNGQLKESRSSRTDTPNEAECASYPDSGYEVLYSARVFVTSPVGFGGNEIPKQIYALRCLTEAPDAVTRLRDLVRKGTMPGQLHALVAIRVLDPPEFNRLIGQYKADTREVETISGDRGGAQSVSVLATRIEQDHYVRPFLPVLERLATPVVEGGQAFELETERTPGH